MRREEGREGEEEEEEGRKRLRRWEMRNSWAVELVPKMILCEEVRASTRKDEREGRRCDGRKEVKEAFSLNGMEGQRNNKKIP